MEGAQAMNPNEIHQYIVNLFRDGPALAAALVVGIILGTIAGRWLSAVADLAQRRRLKELEDDNTHLKTRCLDVEKRETLRRCPRGGGRRDAETRRREGRPCRRKGQAS